MHILENESCMQELTRAVSVSNVLRHAREKIYIQSSRINQHCVQCHMISTWQSHNFHVTCDLHEQKMLITNEWIQLFTSGISVTFNPLSTLTEYHMSGLSNKIIIIVENFVMVNSLSDECRRHWSNMRKRSFIVNLKYWLYSPRQVQSFDIH